MNKLERDNISRRRRRAERKAMAVRLLGGKCEKCGSTDNLHFDHIKNDRVGLRGLISQRFDNKIDILLDELDRCQLLCADCHAQKSILDHGKKKSEHGAPSMYTNKKCRCDDCRAAWASHMRQYKQRMRVA